MTVVPAVIHRWNGEHWTCMLCGVVSADPCRCSCCEHRAANGLLVVSTPKVTCGLVVRNRIVVHGPPYAKAHHWVGHHVDRLLSNGFAQPGITLTWLPELP